LIVLPGDTKYYDAVGLGHPLQDLVLLILRIFEEERHEALHDLFDRLVKLGLARIPANQSRHEPADLGSDLIVASS